MVVVPFLSPAELKDWRNRFNASVASFPEYKDPSHTQHLVQGGFAALGNASSFHCPFSRFARGKLQVVALQLFKALKVVLKGPKDLRMEQMIDRLMSRDKTKKPTAESFHRDQCPFVENKDVAFGGWVNLDEKDQYFSCVKGTHGSVGPSGFKPIKDEKEIQKYEESKSLIMVKPGKLYNLLFSAHFSRSD